MPWFVRLVFLVVGVLGFFGALLNIVVMFFSYQAIDLPMTVGGFAFSGVFFYLDSIDQRLKEQVETAARTQELFETLYNQRTGNQPRQE